jgi:Holliday junction resolvase RusA-like endonuclease
MKLKLEILEIKPIPLNQVYATDFRTKRRFKSKKYNQFESKVNNALREFKNEINRFNKFYNEEKHYITANYRFYFPILTKKEHRVSKTSGDVSNLIKALEDIVFKSLIADDSAVLSVSADKIHSENIRIEIELNIKQIKYVK